MGERLLDTQEVVGSIPIPPTSKNKPSGETEGLYIFNCILGEQGWEVLFQQATV